MVAWLSRSTGNRDQERLSKEPSLRQVSRLTLEGEHTVNAPSGMSPAAQVSLACRDDGLGHRDPHGLISRLLLVHFCLWVFLEVVSLEQGARFLGS